MTTKKTPTLTQLRKLVKRKGLGNVITWLSGDARIVAWIVEIDKAETRGIGAYSTVRSDALLTFLAALSALPDKGAKR